MASLLGARNARTKIPLATNRAVIPKPTTSANEQPSRRLDFFDLAINKYWTESGMNDTQRSQNNSDREVPRKQPSRFMTTALFALLILWVISIAIGTVLFRTDSELGAATQQNLHAYSGWGKPLLVVMPMGLFLTLWAVLLLRKHSGSPK